ncbi:hypothetical protein [Abyssalbus ytuae]|uniref:Uncharacterized protein n=1 Tax=Abyssalbus ytuae TaxID=2926907 RepID=A0A9E7D2D8_9FLAO|nr:hypothetical protein [Abyssalbus ytuae]UOB16584.1 hypothetical protein MQE35_12665 [Abyssalbus ytuae]
MTKESHKSNKKKLIFEAVKELHETADIGMLKTDICKMYRLSVPHEQLDEPLERESLYFSFMNLFNFLQMAEMYLEKDIEAVQLLS